MFVCSQQTHSGGRGELLTHRTSVSSMVIMLDGRGECDAFSVCKYSGKCVWGDEAQSALSAWEGQEVADTFFVWSTWHICQLLHICTLPIVKYLCRVFTLRTPHSLNRVSGPQQGASRRLGGWWWCCVSIISASAPGKEEYSRTDSHHALGMCLWHAWGQVSEDTKTCVV